MNPSKLFLLASFVAGCNIAPDSLKSEYMDPDGDGYEWPEDCDSDHADAYPGATEVWYDGIDQDCAGDDDYDADGDGYVPTVYEGLATANVPGSGELPGGDCWDDPAESPEDYLVVEGSDVMGTVLEWTQPTAAEVNPGAEDTWYDGVDQDCAEDDDFDADADGYRTEGYPDADGDFGNDCVDGSDLDDVSPEGVEDPDPGTVNPAADETWYDGIDQNCDDNDCDADEDGHEYPGSTYCENEDCDDTDPDVFYDPDVDEVWYNGEDENCDGNDGDQDGDGFWAEDYEDRVADNGGEPLDIPVGREGDCWDDESEAADHAALNGYDDLDPSEVYPGAESDTWYDGIDQDCTGDSDFDADGDGWDMEDYEQRDGSYGEDCMDGSALDDDSATGKDPELVNPDALETWYDGTDDDCDGNDGDIDGDGYYTEDYAYLVDDGYEPGDCDDDETDVNPGATELCSTAYDDNCDDDTNDVDAEGCSEWYYDADGDGYGDDDVATQCTCEASGDYSATEAGDCDDADDNVYPEADELCNDTDDDCDGDVDEDAIDGQTWYFDNDGDGYGVDDVSEESCDAPSDLYATDSGDCDDYDADVNPGATEVCDNSDTDEDCNGLSDSDDPGVDPTTQESFYTDADGDGYGDSSATAADYCSDENPSGTVADATDCDDSEAAINPGATEVCDDADTDEDCDGVADGADSSTDEDSKTSYYPDADSDGYGDADNDGVAFCADEQPTGWLEDDSDCDDADADIQPDAEEYCDEVDNDCDDEVDEDDAVDVVTWYQDRDEDGYGDDDRTDVDCDQPSGYVEDGGDCDDLDDDIYPGADEYCDSEDNDCDGDTDEDDAVDASTWYEDADDDGYGNSSSTTTACDQPSGYVEEGGDCDDTDATAGPGDEEVCDGIDNDCDGDVDEETASDAATWYEDFDGDGYGDADSTDDACYQPTGYVSDDTDCDDTDADNHPGADEFCDGVDNDCDDEVDEDDAIDVSTWYLDVDEDGYGVDTDTTEACDEPDGYAGVSGDCDDLEPDANPGADEYCDGIDNNCDGDVDEDTAVDVVTWYYDADGDGYGDSALTDVDCDQPSGYVEEGTDCDDADVTYSPGAREICNGSDNDCDGTDDDDCITVGEIFFTEVMTNPSSTTDATGEWFEIYNGSADAVDFEGLVIRDSSGEQHQVEGSLVVDAGDQVVFARSEDATTETDYVFSFNLGNTSDDLILCTYGSDGTDGTIIDEIAWDPTTSHPLSPGVAMNLDPDSYDGTDNDDGTAWCEAGAEYDTGDLGTPGEYNGDCDLALTAVDPDEGPTTGGTYVTVEGEGLYRATELTFDGDDAPDWVATSDTEILAEIPAHDAGTVDVEVSDDSVTETLSGAFTYTGTSTDIDWCNVQYPMVTSTGEGVASEDIYGQVFKAGVTSGAGQASGIDAQLGYGEFGTDPSSDPGAWSWTDATYNTDTGNNDEYVANLVVDVAGDYSYAYRFSDDSGLNWQYCDTGGSSPSDPYDTADGGWLEVTTASAY